MKLIKKMLAVVVYPLWLIPNAIDEAMEKGCRIRRWIYRPDGTVKYIKFKVASENVKRKCVADV